MKHLSPVLARGLFYIIAAALFAWSCSLTMSFLGDALPEQPLSKYLGLVMLDLGAISWMLVFLKASQGLAQRAIALALSLVDLAGAVLIGFAQIMLGGQTYAVVPKDLGNVAIWCIAIWSGLNLFAVLVFHLMDPTAQREMAQRNAMDKITAEALNQLDRQTDELAAGVAGELAEAWTAHLLMELDTMRRSALRLPEAIDANARDSGGALGWKKDAIPENKRDELYKQALANVDALIELEQARKKPGSNGSKPEVYQADTQAVRAVETKSMWFICRQCGNKFATPERYGGEGDHCPKCGSMEIRQLDTQDFLAGSQQESGK